MRLFKTFFFGYLELKWRRLVRTLILPFIIPFAIFIMWLNILAILKWGYLDDDALGRTALLLGLIILIAIVSYILKPFVVDESHKIKHKKHKPISIFFGYLELKWRRLTRFLSFAIISICYGMLIDIGRVSEGGWVLLASPIIICAISWIIEPFVFDESHKIKHKKHKPISIKVNESKNRLENKKEAFESEQQDEGIWSSILPKVDEQKDSKYFNNLKFIKWLKSLPISILSKPLLIIVEKIYLERDVIVKWILIIIAMVLGNFILYATGIKN